MIEAELCERYCRLLDEMPTMKFADLEVGEKFIGMPLPGDGEGHGDCPLGKGPYYIFIKINENFVRLQDGNLGHCSPGMRVVRIQ